MSDRRASRRERTADVVCEHGLPGVPPLIAIGVLVSEAEQQYFDMLRARSHELAVQRGHIRRYP